MNILELSLKERALYYVNELIVKPLVLCGHLNLAESAIKQLVELTKNSLEQTKSVQQLGSDFGHCTKKWNIDWHWVAYHIIRDFYNIKQAQYILKSFGENEIVYKEVGKTDSIECRKLYLSNPININSEPKIFSISQLIANGSNLGKTKENWKSVIGVTDFGFYKLHPCGEVNKEGEVEHYYDNNYIAIKSEWQKWDESERQYKIEEKPLTDLQKKIKGLIKITIVKS